MGVERLEMLGAQPVDDGVGFAVWAPEATSVSVSVGEHAFAMERDTRGVWSALVREARPGTRYTYAVNGEGSYPDPYSRSQPDGVHGPSEVLDPEAFAW